jgi:peptide/nickel transport system permease protein
MIRIALQRVLQTIPTLLAISVITFALVRLTGDPVDQLVPPDTDPVTRAEIKRSLGLDQPVAVQYLIFLKGAVTGDLGTSVRYNVPVSSLIAERLPATLTLSLSALALATLVGMPLGILAALRPRSLIDRACRAAAYGLQAVPVFYLSLLLILVFSVRLNVLPAVSNGEPISLVMPAIALAGAIFPLIARISRTAMSDVLGQDYVRTARGKGLRERAVVAAHMLPNAAIPIVTILGLEFGGTLSGAVVTEAVFAWPGMGTLLVNAVFARDFAVTQGVALVVTATFVVTNLCVDLLTVRLDPRIRLR